MESLRQLLKAKDASVKTNCWPSDAFRRFPVKVNIMILRRIHYMRDITAAIKASPTLLNIFKKKMSTIMWDWFERNLGLDNVKDALAGGYAAEYACSDNKPLTALPLCDSICRCLSASKVENIKSSSLGWKAIAHVYCEVTWLINHLLQLFGDRTWAVNPTTHYGLISSVFCFRHFARVKLSRSACRSFYDVPLGKRSELMRPFFMGRAAYFYFLHLTYWLLPGRPSSIYMITNRLQRHLRNNESDLVHIAWATWDISAQSLIWIPGNERKDYHELREVFARATIGSKTFMPGLFNWMIESPGWVASKTLMM